MWADLLFFFNRRYNLLMDLLMDNAARAKLSVMTRQNEGSYNNVTVNDVVVAIKSCAVILVWQSQSSQQSIK